MTDISKAEKLARAMDNVRSGGRSFNGGLAAQVSHELRALAAERDTLRAQLATAEAQIKTAYAANHASDCATHNGPAMPAGECDCALTQPTPTDTSRTDAATEE